MMRIHRRTKTTQCILYIVVLALSFFCVARYLKSGDVTSTGIPFDDDLFVVDDVDVGGAGGGGNSLNKKFIFPFQLENARFGNLRLKREKDEVPVVVVDQHQEVIPYWFKAVDEGLIPRQGNTLVHIDGHSDMAPPGEYDIFKRFRYVRRMNQTDYLPLMQSNDAFIVSAIMAGLINKVIWVQPNWNEYADYTQIMSAYIGNHLKSKHLCLCFRAMRKSKKARSKPFHCSILNREVDDLEKMDAVVNSTECDVIVRYKYFVVSESKFQKVLNFKTPRNIIIDIDEDHYGVESGVQNFINEGVSLQSQEVLDGIMSALYCPKSTEDEIELNRKIQSLFLTAYEMKRKDTLADDQKPKQGPFLSANAGESQLEKQFRNEIMTRTKDFICDKKKINEFALFMTMIDEQQLKALSNTKFCLFNSPRISQISSEIEMYQSTGFSVCHGTIFPADKLNKIHVGTTAEIDIRANTMKGILKYISSYVKPSLYTICRSLRDGYTPRNQQRYIEKQVLNTVTEITRENEQKENLIYDSQLVFGKGGWI